MNFKYLSETVSWMKQEGVIHLSIDGCVITLAEAPLLSYTQAEQIESSAVTEEDEFETPQQRIRARLREKTAEAVKQGS